MKTERILEIMTEIAGTEPETRARVVISVLAQIISDLDNGSHAEEFAAWIASAALQVASEAKTHFDLLIASEDNPTLQ